MRRPARWTKCSAAMCVMLPWPAEAKLSVPGFARASAISSGSVFAGSFGLTTTTIGPCDSCTTGVMSATGSKRILYSAGLMV